MFMSWTLLICDLACNVVIINMSSKIFVYFHLQYTRQQIAILNNLVRTIGKVRSLKFSAAFLKVCISSVELPRVPTVMEKPGKS